MFVQYKFAKTNVSQILRPRHKTQDVRTSQDTRNSLKQEADPKDKQTGIPRHLTVYSNGPIHHFHAILAPEEMSEVLRASRSFYSTINIRLLILRHTLKNAKMKKSH
jgi:hypothetical protein